jgi:putative endonuclease
MYYIYFLYSKTADKYYVGHSENPWKRLIQHNSNCIEKYTGKVQDWELMAVFEVSPLKGDAVKLEKFIKKQKSKQLILKLLDENSIPVDTLGKLVRVPHVRD